MPAWPATLPQNPVTDGYSEEPGYPVVAAPVDGPPLTRRRYTASPKKINCSFVMSDAQLATFEDFYENSLKFGSLTYTWYDRGNSARPGTFRITGAPRYEIVEFGKALSSTWRVTLALIRLP